MKPWYRSKIISIAGASILTHWAAVFNGNADWKAAVGGSLLALATVVARVGFTDTSIEKKW